MVSGGRGEWELVPVEIWRKCDVLRGVGVVGEVVGERVRVDIWWVVDCGEVCRAFRPLHDEACEVVGVKVAVPALWLHQEPSPKARCSRCGKDDVREGGGSGGRRAVRAIAVHNDLDNMWRLCMEVGRKGRSVVLDVGDDVRLEAVDLVETDVCHVDGTLVDSPDEDRVGDAVQLGKAGEVPVGRMLVGGVGAGKRGSPRSSASGWWFVGPRGGGGRTLLRPSGGGCSWRLGGQLLWRRVWRRCCRCWPWLWRGEALEEEHALGAVRRMLLRWSKVRRWVLVWSQLHEVRRQRRRSLLGEGSCGQLWLVLREWRRGLFGELLGALAGCDWKHRGCFDWR